MRLLLACCLLTATTGCASIAALERLKVENFESIAGYNAAVTKEQEAIQEQVDKVAVLAQGGLTLAEGAGLSGGAATAIAFVLNMIRNGSRRKDLAALGGPPAS